MNASADEMRRLAADHGLTEEFPAAVRAEVERFARADGIDDPGLEDLTGMAFVTIDGPGTRDLDQALCVQPDKRGFRVAYALADASYYVSPGSALFDEALARGASYYLPGYSVPMLPRELSEGIVSLNEKVARRALVFDMAVDGQGRCRDTTLRRARIRSRGKLTFERVQHLLDDPEGGRFDDDEVNRCLRAFARLGEARLDDAERRDVVRYRRIETEVQVAGDGLRYALVGGGRTTAVERYNEQLSLLCNIEGARLLRRGEEGASDDLQPIYRVHPRPDRRRYAELERLIDTLRKIHRLDERWGWRRGGKSLADYLDALPREGRLGRVAQAIHRQAILLNVRSTFSETPGRHFGVGAEVYARFSAPMREIVGVFLHKEALEQVSGRHPPAPDGTPGDEELRARVVEVANEAKALQAKLTKEANRLVLDRLWAEEPPGATYRGTVLGLGAGRAHVLLDDPPVEIKVYARYLGQALGAWVEVSDDGASLLADGRLVCHAGDEVRVTLRGRDKGGDRWVFLLDRAKT